MLNFFKFVEWLGNLLPHPVSLFALFALGAILLSGLLNHLGVKVVDPRDGTRIIEVISLMNAEGLRLIVSKLVTNFTLFVPLGTVLVTMLGVGVAEASGLLSTAIRSIVLYTPKKLMTFAIVFAGRTFKYSLGDGLCGFDSHGRLFVFGNAQTSIGWYGGRFCGSLWRL